MKAVDSNFTDERDKQHPARVKNRITLQAYDMNGNAITDEKYDLTDSLIALPEIKSELEEQLNANKASALTLEFYDNSDTIWDYFGSGNRRWGIKVEQTYDTPYLVSSNIVTIENSKPEIAKFSPDGLFLFVGCHNVNNETYEKRLEKYSVASNGELTLIDSVTTSEGFQYLCITSDYIYAGKFDGKFIIYDYDLVEIGSCSVSGDRCKKIIISSDEEHAWSTDSVASVQKVYYIDISDKTSPVASDAITGYRSFAGIEYFSDCLYVHDYDNHKLKVYDVSTPGDTPYSLVATVDLTGSVEATYFTLDSTHAILYAHSNTQLDIFDISDPTNPVNATSATEEKTGFFGCKCGIFFITSPLNTNKIYVSDLINYYKIEDYNTHTLAVDTYGKWLDYNGYNILAWVDSTSLKIYTATIWQNWVTLFEGIIDYQSLRKIGRNRTYFTAYTGEKELETYNAEMVYDSSITTYLRNITGVTVSGLTGGTTGAKKLEYTYKTLNEDSSTIDEFGLKYEGGEEFLFREAGTYDLTGASGQIITLVISDTDNLPRQNAEDTMVVGDTEDFNSIGYWYESEEISTIIGHLWDESDFTISTQNVDVDTTATALSDTWQFYYSNKVSITAGDDHSCMEDNPTDSDNILCAIGTVVYNAVYDSTTLSFTTSELLTITDTFADATRVDKIMRLPNGNALVVCVSGIKTAGFDGWSDLEGIMEINDAGAIQHSWNEGTLKDGKSLIAGSSVELINYTYSTGEVVNRNGFYWMQMWSSGGVLYFYVSSIDIDYNPATIYTQVIYGGNLTLSPWVAPNIVYHRYWTDTTPDDGDFHCWYIYADNNGGYIRNEYTGGNTEESLTYCTIATINSIRTIRVNDSQRIFYLITDKMASDKQYIFQLYADLTTVDTAPIDYYINYPVYLTNINKAVAFEMDGSDNAQNLVSIDWNTDNWGVAPPTITTVIGGFMGFTYSPHSVCYLDTDETYIGLAEIGALSISQFFIGSNLSTFIVPIADFTDLNVRQALDKMAEAYVCLWNRPELDIANFISRGNVTDEYTLAKGLYLPQYQITKQPPYLAIEAKNTYYEGRVYLARYPDNYMGEKGNMLSIDNRFITPINKNAIAKAYYDFYNTIRRIFEIEAYYLIELELFDKVIVTLYDINGDTNESVNTVLVEKSFNNNTKTVKLRLVEIGVSAFSSTTGSMLIGGYA